MRLVENRGRAHHHRAASALVNMWHYARGAQPCACHKVQARPLRHTRLRNMSLSGSRTADAQVTKGAAGVGAAVTASPLTTSAFSAAVQPLGAGYTTGMRADEVRDRVDARVKTAKRLAKLRRMELVTLRTAEQIRNMPPVPDDAFDYSDFYHYVRTSPWMRNNLGETMTRGEFETYLSGLMRQFADDGGEKKIDEDMRIRARWILLQGYTDDMLRAELDAQP